MIIAMMNRRIPLGATETLSDTATPEAKEPHISAVRSLEQTRNLSDSHSSLEKSDAAAAATIAPSKRGSKRSVMHRDGRSEEQCSAASSRNKRSRDDAFDTSLALAQAVKAQRRYIDQISAPAAGTSHGVENQIQDSNLALRRAMALSASHDQVHERSEAFQSAGRGLFNLAVGQHQSVPAAFANLRNPFLHTGSNNSANLDLSFLGGANAFGSRAMSTPGSLHLSTHLQGGSSGAHGDAEGMQQADVLAAILNRNHALSRDLASARLMNNNLLFQDQLSTSTATTEDILRNRLSVLQSSGSNTAALEALLGGRGHGAEHARSRDVNNALLSGAGMDSNAMFLRKAAELGLGGQQISLHQHQQLLSNSRLLSCSDQSSNPFLGQSFLPQSGSLNDSSLFGSHSFGSPSPGSLQAAIAAGFGGTDILAGRSQSAGAPVGGHNKLASKMKALSDTPGTYLDTRGGLSSRERVRRDFTMTIPKRQLTDEEMAGIPPLPPCQEGPLPHFTQRTCVALATNEDENWLSEFLCFIRAELVEVFRASNDDVASRINSKKVVFAQVGIRCRYCAHMAHGDRASRSSSFPSSIDRIYQSLTMMIRDHFVRCPGLPEDKKSRFIELKSRTTQGATDSKRYWIESAKRLGMVDTQCQGIIVTEATQAAAVASASPGRSRANSEEESIGENRPAVMIVTNDDRPLVSEYIHFLMTQVEKVHLTESERVGNRKSMELGMPGFGCKHCCASDRKGLCRFFPARRRTLPAKIKDLSDHLRRCTMCPMEVKEKLIDFKRKKVDLEPTEESNKHFFDRVWSRLHTVDKEIPHTRDRLKKDEDMKGCDASLD